jgi:hypothetical protein
MIYYIALKEGLIIGMKRKNGIIKKNMTLEQEDL